MPARPARWRLAAGAVMLTVLWCYTPSPESQFRLCGFHWLTGRPCPLCGLTHALFALAKGHWREAVGFHALSPLAFAMLLSLFWDAPFRSRLWTLGLAAFAAYGVCRIVVPGV